jgi:predicted nucleic acid-binding protein
MKAVSNSSPLIAFSAIDRLDLLNSFFKDGILIPSAVWDEVVEKGGNRPGSTAISSAKWIKVIKIRNEGMAAVLRAQLDSGEAESIVLAIETKPDVLILDERDARRAAKQLGLSVIGTLGILVEAKRRGEINSLRSMIDDLNSKISFRMGKDVLLAALKAVGED